MVKRKAQYQTVGQVSTGVKFSKLFFQELISINFTQRNKTG